MNRFIQYITGVHRIHHINWSYGYKLPILKVAYFTDKFEYLGGKNHGWKNVGDLKYHDCTKTGVY